MSNEIDFSILDYFPLDKTNWEAGTYDQYLYDLSKTVNDNYEKGNYQVAYFYSHLMFMSFVYYSVEKAYLMDPVRIEHIYYPINAYANKNNKPSLKEYSTVYDFSKIPEKDIFKIFYAIGMDDEKIKSLCQYITGRNDFAHATGKGNITIEEYSINLKSIVASMNIIHKLFIDDSFDRYIELLLTTYSYEYNELFDIFNDYIFDNSCSTVDLYKICNLGISRFRNINEKFKENYRYIKKVHCAFIEYCIENYGLEEPEHYLDKRSISFLIYKYKDNAHGFIERELGINKYQCIKEGAEYPLFECPNCENEELVYDRKEKKHYCFACETLFDDTDIGECLSCDRLRTDKDSGICKSCLEHYENE